MKESRLLRGIFLYLAFVLAGLSVNAQVTPDIVVALDGSGNYTKIQQAIDAAPANSDRRTIILIKRGLYNTEKLIIPGDKKNITLIGESREETILSYHIYDCASAGGKCPEADAAKWTGDNIRTSATLTIMADGFRAENLTIQNTAGPVGQAQAITVRGDKTVFINCNLLGYQDTIYFWGAGKRSYFEGCLVAGRTDYIYGDGIAWFEACEIRSWGGGWITAPSTPETQAYGYVFNNCILTYVTGSPRSGDDGAKVALGRPWHNYPKVLWMNTEMTEMIDPLGWPTTWNMNYAATSDKLKLYEYNNTGPGADMSGRANWVGIRAITATEAAEYTITNVFNGWDPTAEAPLVKTYTWTGNATEDNWLTAENWDPAGAATSGVPATGEAATADGAVELKANGETFAADLSLTNGAKLNVLANSTVTYLTVLGAEINTAADVNLGGKIATKGASKFVVPGTLTLNASILGVHELSKEGAGKVVLTGDNSNFSGNWMVKAGTLEANAANSLGKGSVEVSNGASLVVGNSNALQPTSKLKVVTGSSLVLNATVTLSEFYIDGQMQPLGEYTSTTHPNLISGTGKVVVGRPSQFTFIGGTNGNWDNPAHYSPALMPEAGETVIVEKEIETTGTVFAANMVVNSPGRIRLRGANHSATGEITLNNGASIRYSTSGTGFTLNAPITIAGDVRLDLNSGHADGNAMDLPGRIKGEGKIIAHNSRDLGTTATVKLGGDNSGFTGTWDLTTPPRHASATTAIEGLSANAFGAGSIEVASRNRVIFSHEKAAGNALNLSIREEGKAILNADVTVQSFTLNAEVMADGVYSATTHPALFGGTGSITVSNPNLSNDADLQGITVNGQALTGFSADKTSYSMELPSGTTEVAVVANPADEKAVVKGTENPVDVSSGSGTSTILITAEDGSTTKTYTINFTVAATGFDNFLSKGVKVYPNPVTEKLTFENAKDLVSVQIYSLQGALIKSVKAAGQSTVTINVADLKNGFYLLKGIQKDGSVLTGKFMKK